MLLSQRSSTLCGFWFTRVSIHIHFKYRVFKMKICQFQTFFSYFSSQNGAGQQCCYDIAGNLMMTADNKWGGKPLRNHNLGLLTNHCVKICKKNFKFPHCVNKLRHFDFFIRCPTLERSKQNSNFISLVGRHYAFLSMLSLAKWTKSWLPILQVRKNFFNEKISFFSEKSYLKV